MGLTAKQASNLTLQKSTYKHPFTLFLWVSLLKLDIHYLSIRVNADG
jgi:hypothetical protein